MWDLIVSVPDHCLSFYFAKPLRQRKQRQLQGLLQKSTRALLPAVH